MGEPVLNAPIVIEVGKTNRRQIRQLGQGCGKLTADIQDAIADVSSTLGDRSDDAQLIPVVLVYRKKRKKGRKRRSGGRGLFPILF